MISDEIYMKSWAIAARHLARGQRDPTLMIADAIAQERGLPTALVHAEEGSAQQSAPQAGTAPPEQA